MANAVYCQQLRQLGGELWLCNSVFTISFSGIEKIFYLSYRIKDILEFQSLLLKSWREYSHSPASWNTDHAWCLNFATRRVPASMRMLEAAEFAK